MKNKKLKPSPGAKVELVGKFLVKDLPSMRGVDIRTGRPKEGVDDEEEDALTPTCDIYATNVKVVPELEDEWECTLTVRLQVQAGDEGADVLDDRVTECQDGLSFPEDIRPLVNFPLASRPVVDFLLVDIYITGEPVSTHDRYYQTKIEFLVKFRNDAGQGGPAGRG